MRTDENQKWDDYYDAGVPVDPPEVAALGDEVRAWFEALLPIESRKVLEAGSGAGAQSLALAKGGAFEVHLLDSSQSALRSAHELFRAHDLPASFRSGDLFDLRQPEFDLVFNSGVIEHYEFEEQVQMVRSMALASRGLVVVLAPNTGCYWYWISRLRNASAGNWPFGAERPVSNLRAVFEAAGLEIVEERFLGRAWTSLLLNNLNEIGEPLKQILLQSHSSPLIEDAQACYLYGAAGRVKPGGSVFAARSENSERDSLRSMLADALAIRIAGEAEAARLRAALGEAQSESGRLAGELDRNLQERDHAVHAQVQTAQERDRLLQEREQAVQAQVQTAQERDRLLQECEQAVQAQVQVARERDGLLQEREQAVQAQVQMARERDGLLQEREQAVQAQVRVAQERDRLLQERPKFLADLERMNSTVAALQEELRSCAQARVQELETTQVFWAGIDRYVEKLTSVMAETRDQRAWRVMIGVRKAYDLWTRRGLPGKLQALPALLAAVSGTRMFEDQEIRLPSIYDSISPRVRPHQWDNAGLEAPSLPPLAAPLPRKYDLVILAIIDFDFRFQRPQQIAVQFAKDGHRVFWISPTRFLPPESEEAYHLRELRGGLWEVQLRGLQPDIYLGELKPEAQRQFEDSLRQLYRDLAVSENAVIAQLPFWRRLALALRQEHRAILVYDCMDEWDSFENMGAFNRTEERSFAGECDVLAVTAQRLADKFEALGLNPVLVRNGVDFGFFAAAVERNLLRDVPRPVIGYFGAIADWIDLDLVYSVAVLRPQYSFVLIGQVFGRDTRRLESLPNVRLLGNQAYELIPSYLLEFDACTIPFLLNEVTAATDPVKLYEYLSMGKPVVATDMAEIRPYRELIYIAKSATEFASALDQSLAESGSVRERRIEFAQKNTWKSRVRQIDLPVRERFPLISIVIVAHNSERYIGLCLKSILKNDTYPNFEVIVIDNASHDDTEDIVNSYAAQDARIHCERQGENRGFAGGNNRGAELAKGEFLVLLNADTMVTPGWLGRLLRHLEQNPSLGLICPTTNFAGNEAKVTPQYTDESSMEHFSAFLALHCRDIVTEIRMVPLFCALIRRQLYQDLGGLDENYGIGMFEDDDLSEAARWKGLRSAVAEDCFVHHFGQGAFAKLDPAAYQVLFDRNRRYFEKKWATTWRAHKLRPGVMPPLEEARFEPEKFCCGAEGRNR